MHAISPEQAGFSPSRLQLVDATLQCYVDEGRIAGLIALIARHGKAVHQVCLGQMDSEAGRPMQPDTKRQINTIAQDLTSC